MIYIHVVKWMGFPGSSAGKESACNVGDLGSIPGLGRSPALRERLATPVFWPGEFHWPYSPWGHKESHITERLSQAGDSKSKHRHFRNQDCQKKYQKPQIRRWHHPYGKMWRETIEPLDEDDRWEWKSLKSQCSKKRRSWHPVPSLHGKHMAKKWKQCQILFSWAPKSLQTVTAAKKSKDACPLEEKLWQTYSVY